MRAHLTMLASAAMLSLVSCGPNLSTPSLAPRAVEKQPINLPAATPVEADAPADPALVARIATLVAEAETGDRLFIGQRVRTDAAVARAAGTAQGSEMWIVAQQAVTALDAARGGVRAAAGAIDALRQDPVNAAPGNRGAIDAAAARIGELDTAEGAALAALAGRLG